MSFLSKEICCGNSFLKSLKKDDPPETIAMLEDFAVNSMEKNITKAKELGTSKIITACAGCSTRYNHFFGEDKSLELSYYPQFLLKYMDSPELPGAINFYEACHKPRRTPKYKIDTESPRKLVEKIKGLAVREIPNFCCMTEKG